MTVTLEKRPPALDGCWGQWQEQQTDNIVKSEMDAGNVKSRRRFTGINRRVSASVRIRAELYRDFMGWFNVDQRQGAIPTLCMTPYGTEELFQWMAPPVITWPESGYFEASVEMYQGSGWVS